MKSTERHFFHNTERMYHCIIMHIFKKTKTKTKHNKTQLTKHKFDAMWIDFMNKTCSEAVL